MEQERDDASIIAGLLDGDSQAVARIDVWISSAAQPYRRRLQHQWDDLLQDLRLEVLRLLRAGKFQGRSSLKNYLWRVVGHTCLDKIRSQNRWRWTDFEQTEASSADADPARMAHRDHLPAWSSQRDLLLRVLERMPAACRRLWRMIAAGLSYREMSVKVGASEGALRVRVLRCRQQATQVREELDPTRNAEPSSDASRREASPRGEPDGGGRAGGKDA